MTKQEYTNWMNSTNEVADDKNPAFILSGLSNEMLSALAKGEINAQELAKRVLEGRGLNIDGQWAGFKHEIK